MARDRSALGPLAILFGAACLGVGAALALRPEDSQPAPAPVPDPTGNTGIVPPHLRQATDQLALPGNPTVGQLVTTVVAFNREMREWKAYLADLAAGLEIPLEQLPQAQALLQQEQTRVRDLGSIKDLAKPLVTLAAGGASQVLVGLGTAAAAANAVPIVGQVVAAVIALIAFATQWVETFKPRRKGLTKSELDRGVNIRNRPPERNGWERGCYFVFDVPVFGPKVDEYAQRLSDAVKQGIWGKQWRGVYALAKAFPYGPPVPRVEVLGDGTYQYAYNVIGNNDTGAEAQRRGEVRLGQTADPADVRAEGPQADAQKPRAGYFRPPEPQVADYWRGYQDARRQGSLPRTGLSEAEPDYYYQLGLADGSSARPALWKPAQPAPAWRPAPLQVAAYWNGYIAGADGELPRAGFSEADSDYYTQLGVSDAAQSLPPLWPLEAAQGATGAQPAAAYVDPRKGGL